MVSHGRWERGRASSIAWRRGRRAPGTPRCSRRPEAGAGARGGANSRAGPCREPAPGTGWTGPGQACSEYVARRATADSSRAWSQEVFSSKVTANRRRQGMRIFSHLRQSAGLLNLQEESQRPRRAPVKGADCPRSSAGTYPGTPAQNPTLSPLNHDHRIDEMSRNVANGASADATRLIRCTTWAKGSFLFRLRNTGESLSACWFLRTRSRVSGQPSSLSSPPPLRLIGEQALVEGVELVHVPHVFVFDGHGGELLSARDPQTSTRRLNQREQLERLSDRGGLARGYGDFGGDTLISGGRLNGDRAT